MARRGDVFLDEHARVAEGAHRFALRRGERRIEILLPIDAPHALAATARDRLDQHGITRLIGFLAQEIGLLARAMITGHDRHARLLHERFRGILEAHGADRRCRRPDEDDAGVGAAFREFRILGKEAVAWMNGGGVRRLRDLDDLVGAKIALGGSRWPDGIGLIGEADMGSSGIGR